jgi:hypothetical protein
VLPAPLNPRRLERRRVLDASAAELLMGPLGSTGEFVQAGENPGAGTAAGEAANSAPTNVELFLGNDEIFENDILQLGVTFDDADVQDTHTAIIDWGDGTPLETILIDPGTSFLGTSHQYLDDNPTGTPVDVNQIEVTIVDAAGESASAAATLTVKNIAPTIDSISITSPIKEGQFATLTGTFSDPGTQDTYELDIDWDGDDIYDQTVEVSDGKFQVSRQYLDDNPTRTLTDTFDVNVQLRDDDMGFDMASVELTVEDESPFNVVIEPIEMIDEHGFATIRVTFEDSGVLDTHFASINWGDGTAVERVDIELGERSFTATHQYLDDDPTGTPSDIYTIRVGVINDDTGRSVPRPTAEVVVKNVSPVLNLANQEVDEGAVLDLTGGGLGTFTDVGTRDTHTATVNWGDGSATETVVVNQGSGFGTLDGSHVYADDGLYTVTVAIRDDDGGTTENQFEVKVNNVAPLVTLDPIPMINENGEVTLSGAISDPGSLDTFTLDITWGDPLSPDNVQNFVLDAIALDEGADGIDWDPVARTFSLTHQYLDDNPSVTPADSYVVDVSVADDDSGEGFDNTTVLVKNVAPVLSLDPVAMIAENGEATLSGTISDPGSLDTFTLNITWGDPLSPDNVQSFALDSVALNEGADGINWDPVARTFSLSHQYLDDNPTVTPGDSYIIDVIVTDDDSGQDSEMAVVEIRNRSPLVVLADVSDVFENSSATLNGFFIDSSRLDPHRLTIEWDDRNNLVDSEFEISITPDDMTILSITSIDIEMGMVGFRATHQYLDDGIAGASAPGANGTIADISTIRVIVADDDMGESSSTATFKVINLDPKIDSLSVLPGSISEGDPPVTLAGTFSDIGSLDFHSIEIRWGDGAVDIDTDPNAVNLVFIQESSGSGSFIATHQYADNDTENAHDAAKDNIYSIEVIVTDDDGGKYTRVIDLEVLNHDPVLEVIADEHATDVNTNGETFLIVTFSDIGADELTIWVDWGDIRDPDDPFLPAENPYVVETPISIVGPIEGPGTYTVTLKHTYAGPPNPLSPAADIDISVFVTDDDFNLEAAGGRVNGALDSQPIDDPGRSDPQTTTISNLGIGSAPIVIDTTPQVPRLSFPQPDDGMFFVEVSSTDEGGTGGANLRTAVGDTKSTTDSYLELRVIDPATGDESEGIRLKPEVLKDLPGLFSTLPDNRYAIYLVRTETNTERLVIEVYVRNGKVIDPGDDSEGTRDRPPTNESTSAVAEEESETDVESRGDQEETERAEESNPLDGPRLDDAAGTDFRQRRFRMLLGTTLAGLAIAESGRSWADRIDQALAAADTKQWRRLRHRQSPSAPVNNRHKPHKRKND